MFGPTDRDRLEHRLNNADPFKPRWRLEKNRTTEACSAALLSKPPVDARSNRDEIIRHLTRASLVAAIQNLRLVEDVRHVERESEARAQLIRHADIHGLERFAVGP